MSWSCMTDGERVATKEHACEHCDQPIHNGERYRFWQGRWDGEWQYTKMHMDCFEASQHEVDGDPDGSLCPEMHRRGMSCKDMEEADDKLAQELGEVAAEEIDKARAEGKDLRQGRTLLSVGRMLAEVVDAHTYMEDQRILKAWREHCQHRWYGKAGMRCFLCKKHRHDDVKAPEATCATT